jgi:2-keto-4-pentenoate hydratase/2-oxohepta-3-ene-1,7-dioic acid hydratase in catechol pathway
VGFRLGNIDGRAVLVEGDGAYDIERISGGALGHDALGALAAGPALHELAAGLAGTEPDVRIADATLGPPVPNPKHVFAIGLNYSTHAAETGSALPEAPLVFTKFPGCLTGPTATVDLASDSTDYEAELVVVLGSTVRNVGIDGAWDAVAGLTIGQDLSDRDLQNAGDRPQFSLAKSHDGYGPTGPFVVSSDALDDRDALAIECRVNDEVRQSDSTSHLIFSVPSLVSYLSSMMTLYAGDIIFTGTPSGVGLPTRNFLRSGDVVRTTIAGLGELTTTMR